jgi:hypothetical protein
VDLGSINTGAYTLSDVVSWTILSGSGGILEGFAGTSRLRDSDDYTSRSCCDLGAPLH